MGILDIFKSKKGVTTRRIPYQVKENEYVRMMYDAGVKSLQEDNYKHAFDMFSICTENGHTPAKYNLALMYRNGLACDYDFTKSLNLMKEAADDGHDLAKANFVAMAAILTDANPNFNKVAYYLANSSGGCYGLAILFCVDYIQRHFHSYEITQLIFRVLNTTNLGDMDGENFVYRSGIVGYEHMDVEDEHLSPNVHQMLTLMDMACTVAVQQGKPEDEIDNFKYDTYLELIKLNADAFRGVRFV
ncbi:tetratricopeptide repeat protein [Pantoea septica]|uniref:tetratricopeptide repeat protein n=1 Tax=Pantoea septica TaxID=472695 RepID=UPI00289ED332|nr:hypothetical protein [Pantoea septica]